MRRRRIFPAILVASALAPCAAGAAEIAEPIRVQFVGPASCPGEDRFFAEVLARTDRVRRAREGEVARTFEVRITEHEGRSYGTLRVDDAETESALRNVDAPSCAQVLSALAFMAALSVDPSAPSAAPVDAEEAAGAGAAAATAPPPAETAETAAAPLSSAPPEPSRPLPLRTPWLAAGARVTTFAPGTSGSRYGGELFAEIGADPRRLRGASARLSISRSGTGALDTGGAQADITLTYATVDGCPIRLALGAHAAAAPCAGVQLGALTATGADIVAARSSSRVWSALVAEARLDASPLRWLLVELAVGGTVPLTRDDFFFEPSTPAYTAPPIAFHAALDLGARFP